MRLIVSKLLISMPESAPGNLIENVAPYLPWIAMAGLGIELVRQHRRDTKIYKELLDKLEFKRNYFLVTEPNYDYRYDLITEEPTMLE